MKKMSAFIFVLILASTIFMLSAKQGMVQADYPPQPGQGGTDISWWDGWPGPDNLCQCVHTSVWTDDDRCVGIGLSGIYDYCQGYWENYIYQLGQWTFDAGVGTKWNHLTNPYSYEDQPDWSFVGSHYCTVEIQQVPTIYYYDDNPQWTDGSQYDQYSTRSYYPGPYWNEYQYVDGATLLGIDSGHWFEKDDSYYYMDVYQMIGACNGGGGGDVHFWS